MILISSSQDIVFYYNSEDFKFDGPYRIYRCEQVSAIWGNIRLSFADIKEHNWGCLRNVEPNLALFLFNRLGSKQ